MKNVEKKEAMMTTVILRISAVNISEVIAVAKRRTSTLTSCKYLSSIVRQSYRLYDIILVCMCVEPINGQSLQLNIYAIVQMCLGKLE